MSTRVMVYRGVASIDSDSNIKRVCFVTATTQEQATTKICEGIALVYDVTPFEVGVSDIQSEDALKAKGLSRHADWRLFEAAWFNGRCAQWIDAPLFLTQNSRLNHIWASLPIAGSNEIFADSLTQPAERAWKEVAINKLDELSIAIDGDDESLKARLRNELGLLDELAKHKVFGYSPEAKEIIAQVDELLNP